jgi:hypothetical protein
VRFEVIKAASVKVSVFCLYRQVDDRTDVAESDHFWNVVKLLPDRTGQQLITNGLAVTLESVASFTVPGSRLCQSLWGLWRSE